MKLWFSAYDCLLKLCNSSFLPSRIWCPFVKTCKINKRQVEVGRGLQKSKDRAESRNGGMQVGIIILQLKLGKSGMQVTASHVNLHMEWHEVSLTLSISWRVIFSLLLKNFSSVQCWAKMELFLSLCLEDLVFPPVFSLKHHNCFR